MRQHARYLKMCVCPMTWYDQAETLRPRAAIRQLRVMMARGRERLAPMLAALRQMDSAAEGS